MGKTSQKFIPWYGSRSAFDAIQSKASNTLYFISGESMLYKGANPYGTTVKTVGSFSDSTVTYLQGVIYAAAPSGVPTGELRFKTADGWTTLTGSFITELAKHIASDLTSETTNDKAAGSKAVKDYITSIKQVDLSNADEGNLTAVKYVQDYVAQEIAKGTGGRLHPAVNDIAALKAMSTASLQDKDLCLVEAKSALYRWDAESTATADDDKVVLPTGQEAATAGRWIKMTTAADVSTDGKGIAISNNVISLKLDTSVIYTNAGNLLTLKYNSNELEVDSTNGLQVKAITSSKVSDFSSQAQAQALTKIESVVKDANVQTGNLAKMNSNGYAQSSDFKVIATGNLGSDSNEVPTEKLVKAAIGTAKTEAVTEALNTVKDTSGAGTVAVVNSDGYAKGSSYTVDNEGTYDKTSNVTLPTSKVIHDTVADTSDSHVGKLAVVNADGYARGTQSITTSGDLSAADDGTVVTANIIKTAIENAAIYWYE